MDEYTKPYNQRPAAVPGQQAGAPAPAATQAGALPACPHHRADLTAPGAVPARPGMNPSAVVGGAAPPASGRSETETAMPGEMRQGEAGGY